jgi:hypothetical protein
MKYSEVYVRVVNAGYPPLNEEHIRYSLEQGRVRWMVSFAGVKKYFKSLELAVAFRDGCVKNKLVGAVEMPVFINPEPKNRNLVTRKWVRNEYSYEPILLGPGKVVSWN